MDAATSPPPVAKEDYERRCFDQIGALMQDACRDGLERMFVKAATWYLAVIIARHGNCATADVLRQLGVHLDHIEEIERSRQTEGCKPH